MTPRPEREAADRLKSGIEKEMSFLPAIEDFLRRALGALDRSTADLVDVHAAGVGQAVADHYLLVGNVLRQIAKACDEMPAGPEWHKDLLDEASLDRKSVRPPVIRDSTRELLDEFRRFRHVVRNVYGMRIEEPRARDLAARVPAAIAAFREDLAEFGRFLDAVIAG